MKKAKCQHCGTEGFLVTGRAVYRHLPHLYNKWFWKCPKCGARVGCHKGTKNPLGTMARSDLRRKRHEVHLKLDLLWDNRRERKIIYSQLAKAMGIPLVKCHIGLFDRNECITALTKIKTLKGIRK